MAAYPTLAVKSPRPYFVASLLLVLAGGAVSTWVVRTKFAEQRAAATKAPSRAGIQQTAETAPNANRELRARPASAPIASNEAAPAPSPLARETTAASGKILNALLSPPDSTEEAAQRKQAVEQRYGGFLRSLSLPAADMAKLRVLLAAHMNIRHDVLIAARDLGVDLSKDAGGVVQLQIDAQNDILQSLQSLLGDEGMTKLRTYDRHQPERTLVAQLQQRLTAGDTPLALAQADQLAEVLARYPGEQLPLTPFDTSTSINSVIPVGARIVRAGSRDEALLAAAGTGRVIHSPGASRRTSVDPGPLATATSLSKTMGGPAISAAAITQAQNFLSPAQVNVLQQMQDEQRATQRGR